MQRGLWPNRATAMLAVAMVMWFATTLVAQDGAGSDHAAPGIDPEVRAAGHGRTVGDYYRGRGRTGELGVPAVADVTEADSAESPSLFMRYLRVLGWLVVVVGLIFATTKLLKRLAARNGHVPGVGRLLEVIARVPVAAKHQILVVRVGGRALLVGIGPDGMRTLLEIDNTRELLATARGGNFDDRLSSASEGYADAPEVAPAPDEDSLEPYRREVDRLKNMLGNWRMTTARAGSGS